MVGSWRWPLTNLSASLATRVITLRYGAHKEVDLRGASGRHDLLARCLGAPVGDVFGNRAIK